MGNRFSFLALLGASLVCACAPLPATSAPAAIRLPAELVLTLAGEPTDIASVTHGHAALVNLWATWCDGCQREVDALNRLEASTGTRFDAVVVGVAVGEPRAKVAAFAHSRGLRYVQLVDEEFRFVDALGERRVPTTLVIDRTGRIIYRCDAFDAGCLTALRTAVSTNP